MIKFLPGITTDHYSYPTINLERFYETGRLSVPIRVKGYWSRESIHLYLDCNKNWLEKESTFELNVTHSSGGRDPKEVPSDLVAEFNFAQGLIGAVTLGHMLTALRPQLEEGLLTCLQEESVRRAVEKEQREREIEADLPIGLEGAISMMDAAAENGASIILFERGSNLPRLLTPTRPLNKGIKWTLDDHKATARYARIRLSDASKRSHIEEKGNDNE